MVRKVSLSAKFRYQEIRWNYGIFRSVWSCFALIWMCLLVMYVIMFLLSLVDEVMLIYCYFNINVHIIYISSSYNIYSGTKYFFRYCIGSCLCTYKMCISLKIIYLGNFIYKTFLFIYRLFTYSIHKFDKKTTINLLAFFLYNISCIKRVKKEKKHGFAA